jgi:hypothetical protein
MPKSVTLTHCMKALFIASVLLIGSCSYPSQTAETLAQKQIEDSMLSLLKSNILEQQECKPFEVSENSSKRLCLIDPTNDSPLACYDWTNRRSHLDSPLFTVQDIDGDKLPDYTIELDNEGGGCGGQVLISERWTLFSSKNTFVKTHFIPYRSQSNEWISINKNTP